MKITRHQADLTNGMLDSLGENELLSDIVIAASLLIAQSFSMAYDAIQCEELCALLLRTVTDYVENIQAANEGGAE